MAGRAGLDHRVHLPRVQRPGLALTGYTDYIRYGRVQIVGGSEIGYLRKLTPRRRTAILGKLCRCRMTCFVVTKGLAPPRGAPRGRGGGAGVPVLTTPLESTTFIKHLSAFLEERLATRLHLHSVLLDVFGLGVLILGESGIGKSECALDLIDRGHRLVADDVVDIKRMGDVLVGASPDLTRYHMELRGLGVLNIKDLYGVSSIRLSKRSSSWSSSSGGRRGRSTTGSGCRTRHSSSSGPRCLWRGCRWPRAATWRSSWRSPPATSCSAKERGYDAARRFVERVDALVGGADGSAARARSGRRRRRAPRRRR